MSKNASDEYRAPAEPVATAAELAALDSLVTTIEQCRKGKAAFEALELQSLAALSALADQQQDRLPAKRAAREMPLREIAAEVAAAVRMSDRVVQGMIVEAADTVASFPNAVNALTEGRISRAHLTALADVGAAIDEPEAKAEFEAAAVELAEHESVGRFRSAVKAMGERLNPRTMAERHRLARENRAVWVRDIADGMSELVAVLPAVIAHGIHDRTTEQAKVILNHAKADAAAHASLLADGEGLANALADGAPDGAPGTAGFIPDERTLAQVRADVLTDIQLAGVPALDPTRSGDAEGELGAIRALVQVTVPVLTLAGVDDDVIELDGQCPIDPDTARALVGEASGWDRVLTHPVTGAVLAVDRYTPNADLKRWRRATDRRCRTMGCRRPVHRCDLDHNHDAALGGATEDCNLCHFCRRHHTLKHQPGWSVRQLPGGRIEWTTPTGRVYVDEPPPRAAYLPDPPPKRSGADEVPVVDRGRADPGAAMGLLRRHLKKARASEDSDSATSPEVSRRVVFVPDGAEAPF